MLTVMAVTATSLSVTPTSFALVVGATQQLTASAGYNNSTTKNVTTSVTWTSSNAAIATVSASGLVSAVATGQVTVYAVLSGLSATANGSASTPPPLTITAAGGLNITTNQANRVPLQVTVTTQAGAPVAGITLQWSTTSGWLFETSQPTDATGTGSAVWIAGSGPSSTITVTALATGSSGGTATYKAQIGSVTTNTSAIYFNYNVPTTSTPDGLRNQITPVTEPESTFYSAIVFDGGYTGMQRGGSLFDRQLQFSMADDPTGGKAQIIDPGVSTCVSYTGEGTGVACAASYAWAINNPYLFQVTTTNGAAYTDFTATFTDIANNTTIKLGTLRLQRIAKLSYHGSFIEQFSLFNTGCLATAQRKMRTENAAYHQNGAWVPYTTGYIAYSNSVGNCDNMDYGIENGKVFVSTGGSDVGDVPVGNLPVTLP